MTTLNPNNGDISAISYDVVKHEPLSRKENKEIFCARVFTPVKSLREVAETMEREGSKYRAVEIFSILEMFAEVVTRLLQEGYAVNVGSLVRFRPSIRGKFETQDEVFNRSRHRIVVTAAIGSALRDVAANAAVVRTLSIPLPELSMVYNGQNGEPETCVSDGLLIAMGKGFIWDDTAEDEGFFLNYAGQNLPCQIVSMDDKRETVFMIVPHTLNEGDEVELSFRTRHTASGNLAIVVYDRKIVATTEETL